MAENKKLIPKIRFKEFQNTDAWEQRKLGEVVDGLYNGQTPSRFRDELWNGNINWLSSGELNLSVVRKTKEKITHKGQQEANLRLVPKGTFVMAITGLEAAGTRGSCGILGIDTTLNQSCMAVFPDKRRLNTPFLFQWYKKVGEEYGIRYTQGTKQQSYNAELIKKLEISLPKVEEQTKIGTFFSHLDNLIILQQRKLEKTKALKAAYLSEMFPAKGERKPKRRFKGFTGDWEERKLTEFANKAVDNRGKTPPIDSNGTHPLIEVASLGIGSPDYSKVEKFLDNYSFEHCLRDYIEKGDILFSTVGSIGLVSLMDNREDAAIAQNIVAFRAKENYLSEYLYALFSTEKNKAKAYRIVMGAVQPSIKVSQLVNVEYSVTNNKKEQQKIGTFFSHLDNLITLHQRKLKKLQNIKKAYLNEMFI